MIIDRFRIGWYGFTDTLYTPVELQLIIALITDLHILQFTITHTIVFSVYYTLH
jgi:hypothetical protein